MGASQFREACATKNYAVVDLLLKKKTLSQKTLDEELRNAMWKEDLEIIRLLLEDGRSDPTIDDNSFIISASARGIVEIVRLLLEDRRADPRAENSGALHWACTRGNVDVVRLLLEDGRADPTSNNNDIIKRICTTSTKTSTEILRLLLKDGRATPNKFCLINASSNGLTDKVRLLLEYDRVDVLDLLDYHGDALQPACKNGHLETVRILLKHPKINPSSNDNSSILSSIANKQYGIVFELLRDRRLTPVFIGIRRREIEKILHVFYKELGLPEIEKYLEEDMDPIVRMSVEAVFREYEREYLNMKRRVDEIFKIVR